jgi:hypothetical protein
LEKSGKIFVAPPRDGSDFKELFKQLAAAGAGRPLDGDGFQQGPWTPELLAEAISRIDSNHIGVDLRTVQLWFQENDKGISASNIRWLARVFGCDDPEATSEWQKELSEAQSRLAAKRRDSKKSESRPTLRAPDLALTEVNREAPTVVFAMQGVEAVGTKPRFSLARASESLFTGGSPLNLPSSIFAGASALGFLSYIVGIHSATYSRADGVVKQVGFLWAPNWTFLFMVLLPLFFLFVIELAVFWKKEARFKVVSAGGRREGDDAWVRNVEAYSYTYWAVLIICLLFAGLVQWIGTDLMPLLKGGGDYAPSWGTLALFKPNVISVPVAIVFTGMAYLYMCLSFYLFFAGLILLHTIIQDLWQIGQGAQARTDVDTHRQVSEISLSIMRGIFRCTVTGVGVAICMKVQSAYLASNGTDIMTWIIGDMSSAVSGYNDGANRFMYRMPTHYSSLLVAISACVVFLYGSIRLNDGRRFRAALWKMSGVVGLLFIGYLLIDAFDGFSILTGLGVLLATYGLFDPEFGRCHESEMGSNQSVS